MPVQTKDTLKARMNNPVVILPDAMQALFALNKAIEKGKSPDLFDLGQAHELYASLFGPIESRIQLPSA